jgi:hypothetical protein
MLRRRTSLRRKPLLLYTQEPVGHNKSMPTCDICEETVDELITLDATLVCAACKLGAVAQLKEQGGLGTDPLLDIDVDALQVLYRKSISLKVVMVGWAFVGSLYVAATLIFYPGAAVLLIPISAIFWVSALCAHKRAGRDRAYLMVMSTLACVVPVAIGVWDDSMLTVFFFCSLGITGFWASTPKQLFGEERVTHKDVAQNYRERRLY